MSLNYEHLREVAERATPGPWYHIQPFERVPKTRTIHGVVEGQRVDFVSTKTSQVHETIVVPMEGRESTMRSCDMAFIATFNPATVKSPLDELAALRKENEGLRIDAERYRWLRQWGWIEINYGEFEYSGEETSDHCSDLFDQAIDAARAAIGDSHE